MSPTRRASWAKHRRMMEAEGYFDSDVNENYRCMIKAEQKKLGKLPSVTKELYRIRKTWEDAASQKGAYSNLDSAISECKKYAGYSVFNSAGVKVYPVTSAICDRKIKRYAESGKFTTLVDSIYFRDKPCTCHGVIQGSYYKNESVIYDLVVITEKYVWISWIGSGGARRYMPTTDRKTNEKWGVCV